MAPTRILVSDLPRLQGEIVTELLHEQPDVEIVRASATTPLGAATAARANVVILGRDDRAVARGLLEALPRLVVLTLADRQLVAWRYGLTPSRERLGELSPATLTAAIRPPAHPSWWTS